ncbi:glycosyltransferase family 8 protein [Tropicimonas sp. IMCC6043]|uniref:glycosyltransferase family 8 protein n=1 Tax=Tropicimonas sp. IMCC6043 TaxID=2510645 RepID=UPI00101D21F4|nr:glycosyltransferase family 8 protein [Tropicimonas sp. IMCC6043]RYH10311.1 glycosyltransferase family 8 protein [Tropicimonas sp. IMCC6043]
MSDASQIPHFVYFFDDDFAPCTLVSLRSVLSRLAGDARVSLHPTFESDNLRQDVASLAHAFPESDIALREVDLTPWRHLPRGRLPLAARARLLLPDIHSGRVLYLDGDALARRDLTPLWRVDLGDKCIGAALAPGVQAILERYANSRSQPARKAGEKTLERGRRLDGIDMQRYFNSGVMVLDLDAIHAKGLAERMMDIEATAAYTSRDQDWLNMVFRNETQVLDPTWNSGWGNPRTAKRYVSPDLRARFRESREDPAIIHYTGFEKPWSAPRPPFRLHLLTKPLERRLRARYWAEFQTERAATEALLGHPLWP